MVTTNRKSVEKTVGQIQLKISVAVVVSYLFKSAAKLTGGMILSVPPLVGDGIHGLMDIMEHGLLVFTGRHARKPDRENYPLDREPLVELVALGIFLGLLGVGLDFITNGVKSIVAVLVDEGWIWFQPPKWLLDHLPKVSLMNERLLWVAALIFLACYGVSEVVFRYQNRMAEEHDLREMKADAIELRSDGWLEFSMGLGFAGGWVCLIILGKTTGSLNVQHLGVLLTSVILLFLGIYIIRMSMGEIYEKYQNLMNVAIGKRKRIQLEESVNERLPERCRVISPITTFIRGKQLFVSGNIKVDRSMMISADMIMNRAEWIAHHFLSELSNDVRVQFRPFLFWDMDSIAADLNKVLKTVWSVSTTSLASRSFLMLREGLALQAEKTASQVPFGNTPDAALATYVCAEVSLRLRGPQDLVTRRNAEKLSYLLSEKLPISIKIMLLSWKLAYTVNKNGNSPQGENEFEILRDEIENLLALDSDLPPIVLAEASFARGYAWERCYNYDLDKCKSFYQQAEILYAQSGIRSESDRLMNTWGHMETMLYALGDAQNHLELALDIRKLRKDPLSLSFTYGCLGDLYGRLGEFEKADQCYKEDIDILTRLSIKNQIPQVMCKRGESLIRWGLTEKDAPKVTSGIHLCRQSEVDGGKRQTSFFGKKGQVKGLLGLAAISSDPVGINDNLRQCADLIAALDGESIYEQAFTFRLSGRRNGLLGDLEKAQENLEKAINCFDRMNDSRSKTSMGLQSITCQLEIFRHEIAHGTIDNSRTNALTDLEAFLNPFGGLLGGASIRIKEMIAEIREAIDRKHKRVDQAVEVMDRLIWFIEG